MGVQKNRHGGANGAPWPPQKRSLLAPYKLIFLELKLGSILEGHWRPWGATEDFLGSARAPPKPSQNWTSPWLLFNSILFSGGHKKIVPRDLIFEAILGTLLGVQKSALWRPGAAKTPPKWTPTWASRNQFIGSKLEAHLGTFVGMATVSLAGSRAITFPSFQTLKKAKKYFLKFTKKMFVNCWRVSFR